MICGVSLVAGVVMVFVVWVIGLCVRLYVAEFFVLWEWHVLFVTTQ